MRSNLEKSNLTPRVVIIGAGFGGIFAARVLAGKPVDVLLIDRHNYHTFTPLLYQVATCALDPSEIAYPIRGIFRNRVNISCLLGEVTCIDTNNQEIQIEMEGFNRKEHFDYLIIATGSESNYFETDFNRYCFDLRTLEDTITLRNHLLRIFECAAWTVDELDRRRLTTLVVVGGGPTGLETAGALYELYNHVLNRENSPNHPLSARVILIERLPHLLPTYPDHLRQAALDQLQSLGVEVILGEPVMEIAADHILVGYHRKIETNTVIWSAGVQASPVAKMLGVELAHANRLPVTRTLEVIGCKNVYAVGDIAYLEDQYQKPYPMLIPVANQQGELAAKNILRHIQRQPQQEFQYFDRGIMATIGRRRAVAWIFNRIAMRGYLAWVAWLFLHLLTLLGFRNKLNVFVNWVWNYFTYDRSVRIILD